METIIKTRKSKTLKTNFKQAGLILAVFIMMLLLRSAATAQSVAKPRLIVITDIGNEPDDFMPMVRLIIENL